MLPARILATATHFPGTPRLTADLARVAMPDRTVADVEARTGIHARWFAGPDDSTASQATAAIRKALIAADMPASALRRVIFACSTGGDFTLPATANAVLDLLGLEGSADCFDLNNACVGFLSGLDVAARCVATGLGPVAVVASEMPSRHIDPADPRPYVVFGDAAGAAIVAAAEPGSAAVLASAFGNRGSLRETVHMRHASLTGRREDIVFNKSNNDITEIAMLGLGQVAEAIFAQTGLDWSGVDWIVPHQPNGAMLGQIADHFRLDRAKMIPVVAETGNIGAASTAVGLDRLLRSGQVRSGQTILLIGVGSGLSYGALLYRVG